MSTIFIIDIDTTIANNAHRAELLEHECVQCLSKALRGDTTCRVCGGKDIVIQQSSWDKFLDHKLLMKDTPEPKAQEAIQEMRKHGMEYHFITGRNQAMRGPTERWLKMHGLMSETSQLIMRTQSNIPASQCKEQLFLDWESTREATWGEKHTYVFFEDDEHVFRMYSKYGIVVRCPEGWEHWCPTHATGVEKAWSR